MGRYKSYDDRNQLGMVPMYLGDMISPDCEVRALDTIVNNMDIQSLGFTHSETKETGRKL
jgi:transposase